MPKKKMTIEEQKQEIARQVEEFRKEYRAEQIRQAKIKFIEKAFDLLAYSFAYDHLGLRYVYDTAKKLIDDSGLSDKDKDLLAQHFAEDLIFGGGQAYTKDDLPAMLETIAAIRKKLRGQA